MKDLFQLSDASTSAMNLYTQYLGQPEDRDALLHDGLCMCVHVRANARACQRACVYMPTRVRVHGNARAC